MATSEQTNHSGSDAARGFLFALSAYLIWGLTPIVFKWTAHIPSVEVVLHRIVWSVPIAGAVLIVLGRTMDVRAAVKSPRTLSMAALTALLISVNWGIFIWAIAVERTVETALGYYINPLLSVLIGAALLGERFTCAQGAAIGLAVAAVLLLTVIAGIFPWISLALAASFAIYGYLRKTLPIGPSQGFFLEVAILAIPAAIGIIWLEASGAGHFTGGSATDRWLLLLCGPITAAPLILYGFGAKLLRLSTIGLMQYTAPTIIFLIAVFGFREPFSFWQLIAFVMIWTALAIYSWSGLKRQRSDATATVESDAKTAS